jgi:hypothetical protein
MIGKPTSLVNDKTSEAHQNDSREQLAFTAKDHHGRELQPADKPQKTWRGRAATKNSEYLPQRRKGRKGKNKSELGVLGVLARE